MANYGVVEKNISRVKLWLEEGLSGKQIARNLGCKSASVYKKIREHNLINTHKCDVDYDNLLKDKLDIVVQLFESGHSINSIAKTVGHAQPSICALLTKHGYDSYKYKCKYSVDESYFEVVDTPNKAYVLGLWYTDGNVMKSGKCRIQLEASDRHILEEIKQEMKFSGELLEIPARNTSQPQACLCIDRQKIAKDLIKLGCYPNKSLTIKFPILEQVPEHLLSHFIRGVFDGDGSISMKKNIYATAAITSTDVFCRALDEFVWARGFKSTNFYYRRPDKPTGSLFFGRHNDAIAFLDFIYHDANLKLARKYEKYLKIPR